jgi:acetaldehyde dehydrogenase
MDTPALKVALLGVGLIGADLLAKIQRSPRLQCTVVAGRNREAVGIRRAAALGFPVTDGGIGALAGPHRHQYDLVFDATEAVSHREHWEVLRPLGKKVIDLTPSGIGHMVVPSVNASDALTHDNVNLVSCGGQAAIPVLASLSGRFKEIRYVEVVTTASSQSVGRGTRLNLDEYVATTERAVRAFTGVQAVKALVNLSPARPPADFRVAVSALLPDADLGAVAEVVEATVGRVRSYVPGYRLLTCTVLGRERVFVSLEIRGRGDLLPTYAGNLDIMNDTAVAIAEQYAAAAPRALPDPLPAQELTR